MARPGAGQGNISPRSAASSIPTSKPPGHAKPTRRSPGSTRRRRHCAIRRRGCGICWRLEFPEVKVVGADDRAGDVGGVVRAGPRVVAAHRRAAGEESGRVVRAGAGAAGAGGIGVAGSGAGTARPAGNAARAGVGGICARSMRGGSRVRRMPPGNCWVSTSGSRISRVGPSNCANACFSWPRSRVFVTAKRVGKPSMLTRFFSRRYCSISPGPFLSDQSTNVGRCSSNP